MEELLWTAAPLVLTFLVGLAIKSPVYQRGKAYLRWFAKAIEDDKLDAAEIAELRDLLKGK